MTMLTLKYIRILPDVSIALLKDKETGKKVFRHRWRDKAKKNSLGIQTHKNYSTRTHKTIEQFEKFIKKKFNYE